MVDVSPLDMIGDSPWFVGLPASLLQQLAQAASIRPFNRGAYVFTEGEIDTDVYCVVTGRIRIAISSEGGHHFAITDLTHGAWFGEQGLVSETGRAASAEALVNSHILVLPRSAMLEVAEAWPGLYRNLLRHHVARSRELYSLLGEVLFYPLRARVASRLLHMLDNHGIHSNGEVSLEMKLTQNDFARLALGSRQRVNRIFRDWHERGIVERNGDSITVKDLEALAAEVSLET
ncbi:Crp/Fnr family transcriptional regulator [Seongchinamella sediminis]|uniref:Crp/Fnr family transcriptional regulator n=1 Tax=Seongchinamella sediminis TaxID=2283635 RepID=A0A3L7DZU9_9GAMM|nr:Crp/Fnr family transcriptional regulator [Seongchinamella sediminis]RLQ22784.1 Crp/Fnr family transcriptional regulator [Seongchinamella sediminis]